MSFVEVYPTLVETCDVDGPAPLDGDSLLPLLGDPGHDTDRAVVTTLDPGDVALRTDRWRYVRCADGSEGFSTSSVTPTSGRILPRSRGISAG